MATCSISIFLHTMSYKITKMTVLLWYFSSCFIDMFWALHLLIDIICRGPLKLKTEPPKFSRKVRSEIYVEKGHFLWPRIAFIPLHQVTIIITVNPFFTRLVHIMDMLDLDYLVGVLCRNTIYAILQGQKHFYIATISHISINRSRQDLVAYTCTKRFHSVSA